MLLELDDARCDAIQVKSQADGLGPLKGTDDAVLKSLRSFALLEHEFGAKFRHYQLACITGFYRERKAASNLGRCLKQAALCPSGSPPERPLSTLLNRMKVPAEVPRETILDALRKVRLDESLPKLEDMETRVREAIERLDDVGSFRSSDLVSAATAVIDLAFRAGAATESSSSAEYVAYLDDPESHAAREAIKAKRITVEALRQSILDAAQQAASLRSKDGGNVSELPKSSTTARLKLDAGGINLHTVGILEDLRSSAEFEISNRLYRDGSVKTNEDYDHLKVLVRTLAEDARLHAAESTAEPYGPAMYGELRRRLGERCAVDASAVRGFTPEQLTGLAVILTELCKVWWSEPFALDGSHG